MEQRERRRLISGCRIVCTSAGGQTKFWAININFHELNGDKPGRVRLIRGVFESDGFSTDTSTTNRGGGWFIVRLSNDTNTGSSAYMPYICLGRSASNSGSGGWARDAFTNRIDPQLFWWDCATYVTKDTYGIVDGGIARRETTKASKWFQWQTSSNIIVEAIADLGTGFCTGFTGQLLLEWEFEY